METHPQRSSFSSSSHAGLALATGVADEQGSAAGGARGSRTGAGAPAVARSTAVAS